MVRRVNAIGIVNVPSHSFFLATLQMVTGMWVNAGGFNERPTRMSKS